MSVTVLNKPTSNLVEDVAWVARISNPANRVNTETSERLVRYLIKNKHWSPFEMFSLCLEIETTRDIGRQILRHRSFSFQEFSQRYAEVSEPPVYREARLQDSKNRQSSKRAPDGEIHLEWLEKQQNANEASQFAYKWALKNGIAKEQARAVLPEGITATTMLMAGTIRSWIHYIDLRTEAGTQAEHRRVAIDCALAIEPFFPMIKEFVHEAGD
jgi:thymidylate synthase (FAD)